MAKDALAMMVAVAAGANLHDVTTVGVLDKQEGEDLWSAAAESAGAASCQQEAVEGRGSGGTC
jgi:hypothetical protein